MKRQILNIQLFLCSFGLFAQVHTGDLILTTQAEIDNFNYTEVTGQLTISETSSGAITNLNGLNSLMVIRDGLLINNNDSLTTLNGLENLTTTGGSVIFDGTGVGINITNNSTLTSLSALYNIMSTGGNIIIDGNDALTTLDGLQGITTLDSNLKIENNNTLTTLNGLNNITSIEGVGFFGRGVYIRNNNALTDLSGLTNLTSIIGSLEIYDNDNLISLSGLNSISSIQAAGSERGLYIGRNNSLTSLNGLNNLTILEADLIIFLNDSLTSLSGLNNLNSISYNLEIKSNYNLISLQGLDNLKSIRGWLVIGNVTNSCQVLQGNISLTTLNNLSNLTFIGGNDYGGLTITGCDALVSLDGLENLNTLQQEYYYSPDNRLQIGIATPGCWSPVSNFYNPQLSDFCGIQRLATLGELTSSTEFIVANNAVNPTISDIEDLSCTLPPPSQTVFRWRTATDNGNTITETIDNVTVTFSGNAPYLYDVSGLGIGVYSGGGFDYVAHASSNTNVTFSFSEAVDVVSIMTSRGNTLSNHIFTPSGGNNDVVSTSQPYPSKVDLNWEDVTSFTVSTDNSYFGFDDLRVNTNSALSTSEYVIKDITVYPNPTTNYLYIQSNSNINSAEIYSLQGQKIATHKNQNNIDVRDLSNGIYFLKLADSSNRTQSIKFIKQ